MLDQLVQQPMWVVREIAMYLPHPPLWGPQIERLENENDPTEAVRGGLQLLNEILWGVAQNAPSSRLQPFRQTHGRALAGRQLVMVRSDDAYRQLLTSDGGARMSSALVGQLKDAGHVQEMLTSSPHAILENVIADAVVATASAVLRWKSSPVRMGKAPFAALFEKNIVTAR